MTEPESIESQETIKREVTPEEVSLIYQKYSYEVGQRGTDGRHVCGSRRASWPYTPEPCQSPYVWPNGRCRLHGGKNKGGIYAPSFKTGEYSKYIDKLPVRMAGAYEEALQEDDPTALRHEIALVQTMIEDSLGKLADGESGKFLKRIRKAIKDFDTAVNAGDTKVLLEAAQTMRGVAFEGASHNEAINEVLVLIEQKRRLAESDHKRQIQSDQTFNKEKAWLMLGFIDTALSEALYKFVDAEQAEKVLSHFALRLRKIVGPSIGKNDK